MPCYIDPMPSYSRFNKCLETTHHRRGLLPSRADWGRLNRRDSFKMQQRLSHQLGRSLQISAQFCRAGDEPLLHRKAASCCSSTSQSALLCSESFCGAPGVFVAQCHRCHSTCHRQQAVFLSGAIVEYSAALLRSAKV